MLAGTRSDLLDPSALAAFLDARGLGSGPVRASRIGDGASNLTYLVERDDIRMVVRRPPPPPLPPSAHDVIREARVQLAVARAGGLVPKVLAVCEDASVVGAPFYVMEELQGAIVSDTLPAALDTPRQRGELGAAVVDALADLHAVSWTTGDLEGIGRPSGYLERQLRRWTQLWDLNATRELRLFHRVARRLQATVPAGDDVALVHGDYRLGNLMVALDAPSRILAVLDWEMATLGDPLADLGYLVATWSEPGAPKHPLLLSPVTEREGFPDRATLAARYAERTGRDTSRLAWYEALALWKAAVFCEAIYGRFLNGEREDEWAGSLAAGVPALVELAAVRI